MASDTPYARLRDEIALWDTSHGAMMQHPQGIADLRAVLDALDAAAGALDAIWLQAESSLNQYVSAAWLAAMQPHIRRQLRELGVGGVKP